MCKSDVREVSKRCPESVKKHLKVAKKHVKWLNPDILQASRAVGHPARAAALAVQ